MRLSKVDVKIDDVKLGYVTLGEVRLLYLRRS